MKKIIIVVLSVFLLAGCRKNKDIDKTLQWRSNTAYDTFVIEPFNTDRTLVPEEIHSKLPRNFVLALADSIQSDLQNKQVFSKVIQSSECPANGLKLQGQLYALEHHMRSYETTIRGELVECKSSKSICKFDLEKSDSEIVIVVKDMTQILMDKIGECLNP